MIIGLDRQYQHYKSHNIPYILSVCKYMGKKLTPKIAFHHPLPSIGSLHSPGPCIAGPERPATCPKPGKQSRAAGNASACHWRQGFRPAQGAQHLPMFHRNNKFEKNGRCGAFWCGFLELDFGVGWGYMLNYDICWYIVIWLLRYILIYCDMFWYIVMYCDIRWYIMV